MKNIIYYQKKNWKIPFLEFIDKLQGKNKKLEAIIYNKISLLSIDKLSFNDIKFIKDKVYELRIKDSLWFYRIFYFSCIWNNIIILDWFIKKDNKLKKGIFKKILLYKKDFLQRFAKYI